MSVASTAAEAAGKGWSKRRHADLVLLALAVGAGSFARVALGPFQESARSALELSDNHLALLQGPALALPLLILSIPLGILIDRRSRVRLLILFAAINVAGTIATAFSSGFLELFIARSLVGFTAVAINPVALSLIADFYSPSARGRAHTIISVGQIAGMSGAFAAGGWLLAQFGSQSWQQAMSMMAVPLSLVLLLALAMREPPRSGVTRVLTNWRDTLAGLMQFRAVILPLGLGAVVIEVGIGSVLVWTVPTLTRGFSLSPDQIGTIMSLGLLIGGLAGPLIGGILADYCQTRGGPRQTMAVLVLIVGLSAAAAFFPLAPTPMLLAVGLTAFVALVMATIVISTTLFTLAIPNELRGLSMSILAALCVLSGNGIAPPVTSLLSAMLGGSAMIGLALCITCVSSCVVSLGIFAAGISNFPREAY